MRGDNVKEPVLGILGPSTVHPHMRGDNAISPIGQIRSTTVHPHMRGDNHFTRVHAALPRGSPPHAWGADDVTLLVRNLHGSPPHAWGQSLPGAPASRHRRFTPTCVGTMAFDAHREERLSVHPHMRGDNARMPRMERPLARFTPTCVGTMLLCICDKMRVSGSPPHAWGQFPLQGCPVQHHGRFTPTCVGDNAVRASMAVPQNGSPPHAWGQFLE